MILNSILVVGAVALVAIGVLVFLLLNKNEKLAQYQQSLVQLKKSFNDLDEQAKIIIKTDLELNRAQEVLDRRLNGLDALQRISRSTSTTLDQNEIFRRLNDISLAEIGFEKLCILLYNDEHELSAKVALGIAAESGEFIKVHIQNDVGFADALAKGTTLSSLNTPTQRREALCRIFNVEHFIIAPILTQHGSIGIVFTGNQSNAAGVTSGDEELVSILASQIGQAIENAQLFEQVFRSSKVLETKIQDRTKQLASALETVQDISKKKSEFISAVSHELRTPLTSIKGYAAILIAGKLGEVPDAVKQRLEKINTHSDNLVKLINDLLDISRIESGRVEMRRVACDLTQMIENVHDLLTPQMKQKNIIWKAHVTEHMPQMLLDNTQVERVFINLVGNAIKFTPEGGTISVDAKLENDLVTVSVSDTGIGISKEDMSKLFSEFFRVDNKVNENVKGTGLGLALAKKIVLAHHGTMWVTSELNKGTSFLFTLPVNPSPTTSDTTQPTQP